MRNEFYEDRRYCKRCDEYVPFLLSPEQGYCAECGAPVTLFSRPDQARFARSVAREQAAGRKRGSRVDRLVS